MKYIFTSIKANNVLLIFFILLGLLRLKLRDSIRLFSKKGSGNIPESPSTVVSKQEILFGIKLLFFQKKWAPTRDTHNLGESLNEKFLKKTYI